MTENFKVKTGLSPELKSDIFEIYRKSILPVNKPAIQVRGPTDKRWHRNRKSRHIIIFPNACKAIIYLWTLRPKKHVGSRKHSLRVTQNIYLPNRFYLTFPNDNFWNFDETLNVIKNVYAFIQIYVFPLSLLWLTLISFFL